MRYEQWPQAMKDHFAQVAGDLSSRELAAIFPMRQENLRLLRIKLGIEHSPLYYQRMKKKMATSGANLAYHHTPEVRERISAELRRIHNSERRRALLGLPQNTKLHICLDPKMSRRRSSNCGNMKYRYGYILHPTDKFILLYDDNTRRRPDLEAKLTERYSVSFRHVDDRDPGTTRTLTQHDYCDPGER